MAGGRGRGETRHGESPAPTPRPRPPGHFPPGAWGSHGGIPASQEVIGVCSRLTHPLLGGDAQLRGGCSPLTLRILSYLGGCSSFTWGMLMLYFKDAQSLRGCSPFIWGDAQLLRGCLSFTWGMLNHCGDVHAFLGDAQLLGGWSPITWRMLTLCFKDAQSFEARSVTQGVLIHF